MIENYYSKQDFKDFLSDIWMIFILILKKIHLNLWFSISTVNMLLMKN